MLHVVFVRVSLSTLKVALEVIYSCLMKNSASLKVVLRKRLHFYYIRIRITILVSFGPASTVWSVTLQITIGYHNLSRLYRGLCGFRFLKAFLKAFCRFNVSIFFAQ